MDLDGRALAERLRNASAAEVDALLAAGHRPRLVALQVGSHPAAEAYVRGQRRAAESWRIEYVIRTLPADASEASVRAAIAECNEDPDTTGILLQLPLPAHLHGRDDLAPCTARAAIALLESSGAPIEGAEAVVVGHSEIVGKPVALMLLARNATTTVCHKFTKDLASHTRRADLLVVAVGRPNLVTATMVKPGAVVVDVGINEVAGEGGKRRIVGDVDYDGLTKAGCSVTPVPGGVGPVTVAMLMRNTLIAARRAAPDAADEDETPPLFVGLT